MKIKEVIYKPIGVIHSEHLSPKGTPIQTTQRSKTVCYIEIYKKYVKGLKDLEGYSHIILIYHFHLSGKSPLLVKPFLDRKLRGVFATRAPGRPNPIGFTVVSLVGITGNKILIKSDDIVDGTPLLDIKPYIPKFDIKKVKKTGWVQKKLKGVHAARDDGRFTNA
ncbi:MAG: tRNA (N6-threonylcarbamoyladenosine(37)-N6)-methyltransferase TrmO [Ignavibacteria bacterium]|nr:tRNA (N6-threonylcarbamoyladenosine(37)-N6)-methyltransferase TrmO [Ignavibacteria bacterium]